MSKELIYNELVAKSTEVSNLMEDMICVHEKEDSTRKEKVKATVAYLMASKKLVELSDRLTL